MQQALEQSFDLKIAQTDVRLTENQIRKAKSDYMPVVRAQSYMEYMRDLTNGQTPVAVVGSTTIPNATRFQNAVYLSAALTVYDFGARASLVDAARRQREAAGAMSEVYRRDLAIALIDKYTQASLTYTAIKSKERLLEINRQIFQARKRLAEIGKINQLFVSEAGLEVARTFAEIHELKQLYADNLTELSALTHQSYSEAAQILPMNEDAFSNPNQAFVVQALPEYRLYQAQIDRKKAELVALKRQLLPQIGVYSNFYMYGSNTNNWVDAIGNFRGRTISFGFSATMPIFDGFKNSIDRKEKQLEIVRIEQERDKKFWELKQQHERYAVASRGYAQQTESKSGIYNRTAEKVVMARRLTDNELLERTEYLQSEAKLIQDELEVQRSKIQQIASRKKLIALSEI